MDRTKLIGIVIAAAALLALLLLKLLKRKDVEAEGETEEEAMGSSAGKRGGLGRPEQTNHSCGRHPEPPAYAERISEHTEAKLPVCRAELPAARTMLLTYNTLILTDVNRPARSWKADLFQPVYVGRSRECGICIREDSVSRRHLRVFRQGAHVYAENLNAVNGTFLNGKILKEPKEIRTGSRLRLGRVELSVEID